MSENLRPHGDTFNFILSHQQFEHRNCCHFSFYFLMSIPSILLDKLTSIYFWFVLCHSMHLVGY